MPEQMSWSAVRELFAMAVGSAPLTGGRPVERWSGRRWWCCRRRRPSGAPRRSCREGQDDLRAVAAGLDLGARVQRGQLFGGALLRELP